MAVLRFLLAHEKSTVATTHPGILLDRGIVFDV
jgi:hypothetical protein